jgi:hypothetical protein
MFDGDLACLRVQLERGGQRQFETQEITGGTTVGRHREGTMTEHKRPQHCAILIRHAKREVCWDKPEDRHKMAGWKEGVWPDSKSDFDEGAGFALTHALAGRLCDQLLADDIAVKKIFCGGHLVAEQTASVYKDVIEEREINKKVLGDEDAVEAEMEECGALSPGCYSANALDQIREDLESQVVDDRSLEQPVSVAYVLVGHQPELTTIARHWLKKRRALPSDTLPIGGSEAACVRFGDDPRLLWLITNKSDDLMSDLKDKIKSKYDVAKFFLGAFVVNTGLILNAGVWGTIGPSGNATWIDKALVIAAVVSALVSLAFTAATLFSYDALLMPSAFWSERSDPADGLPRGLRRPPRWGVSRPPSQAHVVLFYEMVHIWTVFFVPAVVAAFAAVGLLIIALARQGIGVLVEDPLALAFSLVIAAFLLPWAFYQSRRARLGSED